MNIDRGTQRYLQGTLLWVEIGDFVEIRFLDALALRSLPNAFKRSRFIFSGQYDALCVGKPDIIRPTSLPPEGVVPTPKPGTEEETGEVTKPGTGGGDGDGIIDPNLGECSITSCHGARSVGLYIA